MDFNEIKNTWKNSNSDKHLSAYQIEQRLAIKSRSGNIVDKVKRNYIIGMIMLVITFIALAVCVYFYLFNMVGLITIIIVTIIYGAAFVYSLRNYWEIKNTVFTDDTIIPALKKVIHIMETSIRFGMSNFYKYVIIPMSFVIGVSIGIFIGAGERDYLETIYALETRSIVKIVLVIVIGSLLTIYYSQKMIKKMYAQYMDELKKSLEELEEKELN